MSPVLNEEKKKQKELFNVEAIKLVETINELVHKTK
jgi:hypothetical protein